MQINLEVVLVLNTQQGKNELLLCVEDSPIQKLPSAKVEFDETLFAVASGLFTQLTGIDSRWVVLEQVCTNDNMRDNETKTISVCYRAILPEAIPLQINGMVWKTFDDLFKKAIYGNHADMLSNATMRI